MFGSGPYEADKPSGCGHLFIAIDVATLGSPEEFNERVQALIDDLKATPLAQDAEEIFFPENSRTAMRPGPASPAAWPCPGRLRRTCAGSPPM